MSLCHELRVGRHLFAFSSSQGWTGSWGMRPTQALANMQTKSRNCGCVMVSSGLSYILELSWVIGVFSCPIVAICFSWRWSVGWDHQGARVPTMVYNWRWWFCPALLLQKVVTKHANGNPLYMEPVFGKPSANLRFFFAFPLPAPEGRVSLTLAVGHVCWWKSLGNVFIRWKR